MPDVKAVVWVAEIQQQAVKVLIEKVAEMIDAKISHNNSFYVNNKFKNWRVTGSQISPHSIEGYNLADGSIPVLKVQDFIARSAQIAVAEIATATIDTAQIHNLEAYVASMTYAIIEHADITWASIASLTATIAEIAIAQIELATINWANIEGMTVGEMLFTVGSGGKLYIRDLAVTDANVVGLTAGQLIVAGTDGKFYQIIPDGEGGVTSIEKIVPPDSIADNSLPGGKIIEDSITARELNVAEIFADEALIRSIKAINLDVAEIFASSMMIGIIKAKHIDVDELFANSAMIKRIKSKNID